MPLSRQIPHVESIFRGLSSVVGEGDFLQETVPVVTREEVFAGQAALGVALAGQVSSTVQCNTPLCWTPAPAARRKPGSQGQVHTGLHSGSGRIREWKGFVQPECCQEQNT